VPVQLANSKADARHRRKPMKSWKGKTPGGGGEKERKRKPGVFRKNATGQVFREGFPLVCRWMDGRKGEVLGRQGRRRRPNMAANSEGGKRREGGQKGGNSRSNGGCKKKEPPEQGGDGRLEGGPRGGLSPRVRQLED